MSRLPFLLPLIALVACAPKHVVLQGPLTERQLEFECESNQAPENCAPSKSSVSADESVSGSVYINMPEECSGHFNKIIVRNVNTRTPSVYVVCAAPDVPPPFEKDCGETP